MLLSGSRSSTCISPPSEAIRAIVLEGGPYLLHGLWITHLVQIVQRAVDSAAAGGDVGAGDSVGDGAVDIEVSGWPAALPPARETEAESRVGTAYPTSNRSNRFNGYIC